MPMNVLHIVPSMKREAGLVALLLPGLVGELRRRGFESTVASPEPHGDLASFGTDAPLRSETAERLVGEADVIHIHGVERRTLGLAWPALRGSETPFFVSPLGGLSPNPFDQPSFGERLRRRFFDKRIVRRAAGLFALHEREANQLRSAGGDSLVQIVPYGVDFDEFSRGVDDGRATSRPESSAPTLLYLGPLHPVEGLVPLLRAVGELGSSFDGWRIVIAGPSDAGWQLKLAAAIERKGATDRVTFVADPDVVGQHRLLAEAALVVAPALVTRCPTSVLTAIAAGVRVIAAPELVSPEMEEFVTVSRPVRDELRRTMELEIARVSEARPAADVDRRSQAAATLDWSVRVSGFIECYESARPVAV